MATRKLVLDVAGREVTVSNPDKVYFPRTGHTKLDLVNYYLAVAEGALRGVTGRPMALKRFVNGAEGEFFFQKRAPEKRPEWVETIELKFPSGRSAHEIVVRDPAQLAWVVNLGCIDLNPHPVRAADVDRPDELRVDLGCRVAFCLQEGSELAVHLGAEVPIERVRLMIFRRPAWGQQPGSPSGVHLRHGTSWDCAGGTA